MKTSLIKICMYFIEILIDISFYVFLGMLALKIFIVLVI